MAQEYISLVSSLPHLPAFEKAERSLITRLKLDQRLHSLSPEDAKELACAEALVSWRQSLAKPKTDKEMVLRCRTAIKDITQAALREFIEYRIDQQTVLAALRKRRTGIEVSVFEQNYHAIRWTGLIASHWDQPDFKLAAVFPWIAEAQHAMEAEDAIGLDTLMMRVNWQKLSRITESSPYGFEAVFAFVFKWDILEAWLARDADEAKNRFQALIKEVTNDR